MNALEVIIGEMLGGAARLALSLDQDHQPHLARLEGQSLCIHCTNPPQRITLRVAAGQLAILPGSDNPTDATVTGPLTDLIALLRGGSPGKALRVNGDPTVLRDFARLFENYDPDFSALLPDAVRNPAPGSPIPGPGAELFEQLRGVAEVGFASIGRVLQSAVETGQDQVKAASHQHFANDQAFTGATERLQQLQQRLQTLTERVDALEPKPNAPT